MASGVWPACRARCPGPGVAVNGHRRGGAWAVVRGSGRYVRVHQVLDDRDAVLEQQSRFLRRRSNRIVSGGGAKAIWSMMAFRSRCSVVRTASRDEGW